MEFLLNNHESDQTAWMKNHAKRILLYAVLLVLYFAVMFILPSYSAYDLWSAITYLMICGVIIPLFVTLYLYRHKERPLKFYLLAPVVSIVCSLLIATPLIIFDLDMSGTFNKSESAFDTVLCAVVLSIVVSNLAFVYQTKKILD